MSSFLFFFSSRRRHTRYWRDWSSDVCSSDLAGVKFITYGIDAHADVQGTILAADASGSRVRVESHGETVEIALPLVGRFNVHNALAAIAAGLAAGVPLAKAR